MTVKVIGLMNLADHSAFDQYRSQVGRTVELYQGKITSRGSIESILWNELESDPFNAIVELEFPNSECVQSWANSEDYLNLIPIRNKAMQLTLFTVT
ncbi:DUF1330 domain-containing protein [Polynucleobacter brandtiae]|uniref:Uncharacterized protein (DUF1330 family) n=1 Tax=Polynucleobacter brandtiae TaxID=1938816 RepID=A0A2M8VYL8_9BURK|nr:DUF1330 domain-containing protein [Polynucleobacter brandtiae]PJI82957.1 uncharacterized protein (DUF1330 family) [Polynucleobacter brandtiae]